MHYFAYNLVPSPKMRYEGYSLRRKRECAKHRLLLQVLHSDAMGNGHTGNRRSGGGSTHKIAYFIHRSICGAANIEILNWGEKCGDSTSLHVELAWKYRLLSFQIATTRLLVWVPRAYENFAKIFAIAERGD